MPPPDVGPDAPGNLCTQCALCCNGTLFVDVRLIASDSVVALESCGVSVWKRRGAQSRFHQPCACLQRRQCRIYESRPNHCRAFECSVLGRVKGRELSPADALRIIRAMQRRAQRVDRLLRQLGQVDDTAPLATRYSRLMRTPMDLHSDPEGADRRGRLMLEMHRLMTAAQRDFLDGAALAP